MKKIRHIVTNWLTRRLLKAVTVDEIMQISGKDVLVGKHKFSSEEIMLLKEDAKILRESMLYRLLLKEVKYHATLQRFDHAKNADDMIFGKAMLYDLDLIARFIRNISTLQA